MRSVQRYYEPELKSVTVYTADVFKASIFFTKANTSTSPCSCIILTYTWGEGGGEGQYGWRVQIRLNSLPYFQAKHQWTKSHVPGMGSPEIHFGDSEVYLYHIHTGKYIGFTVSEQRHRLRMTTGVRKTVMQHDFNQSFAFTMTRASAEQAKAANIVQLSESVMRNYVHK